MSTTVPTQVIVKNGTSKPLGEVLTEQSTALANTIPLTAMGAKGDLLVGSGPGAYLVLPIGLDGQVLVADSTQTYGMLWKPVPNTFANGLTVSGGVATFNAGLTVPAGNIITADTITALTNTLTLKGVAANGGVAVALDNGTALTSGKLVSVRNGGVEKAYVDLNGGFWTPGGGTLVSNSLSTYGTTSLTLAGNIADSATAVGLILNNNVNLVTAGAKILSVRNAGVEKAYIDYLGAGYFSGQVSAGGGNGTIAAGLLAPSSGSAAMRGNVVDGATAIANRFRNAAALVTAGAKIASFYSDDGVTERAYIGLDGRLFSDSHLSYGADAVTVKGQSPDGATAVGVILDNFPGLVTAGSKLLSIRNGGVEKAFVTKDGGFIGTSNAATVAAGAYIPAQATFVNIQGSSPDSATAIGVRLGNTPALVTAVAKIASFYNDAFATEKAYIDLNGNFVAIPATSTIFAGTFTSSVAASARLKGAVADGATAIANQFGNSNALANVTAKIVSFYNDNLVTEAAYIDRGGSYVTSANVFAGTFIAQPAGTSFNIKSNAADGATAIGTKIGSINSLITSGAKLVSFYSDNMLTERAYIDRLGGYAVLGGGGISSNLYTSSGTAAVQVRGGVADSATAIGLQFGNSNALVTAGAKIASFYRDNLTTEVAYVRQDGYLYGTGFLASSVAYAASYGPYSSTASMTLFGRIPDGATAIANKLGNANTLATAGAKIASFYSDNMVTEKAYVDLNGNVFSGGTVSATGTSSLTIKGQNADSATAVGVITDTPAYVTTGARLLSIRNNAVEKAYFSLDGTLTVTGSGLFADSITPYSGTFMNIRGGRPDSATSTAVKIGNVNALVTAGAKIVSFYNDNQVTEKAFIDKDGGYAASGGGAAQINMLSPYSAVPLQLRGTQTDSATTIGVKIGNNYSLATAGAKIASFYSDNFTTEKAFVDKDGKGSFTGGVSPGTPALASQTGRIFQGSGAPVNANGADGDFYFRTDTPGTAGQRLYARSAGTWTGLEANPQLTASGRISQGWAITNFSTPFTGIGVPNATAYGAGSPSVAVALVGRTWMSMNVSATANTTVGYKSTTAWTALAAFPKVSTRVQLRALVGTAAIFELADPTKASGGGAPAGVAPAGTGAPTYTPTLGGTNADTAYFVGIHYDYRVGFNWILGSGDGTTASWIDSGVAANPAGTPDWLLSMESPDGLSIIFTITNLTTGATSSTTKTTNLPGNGFGLAPYVGAVTWAGGGAAQYFAYVYMEHN